MRRREFVASSLAASVGRAAPAPGFRLTDVTKSAGITFRHNSGAFGRKYLPETLGAGCAFFDYDADGWQDILLVNGADWPGHRRQKSTLHLYRNNRNGTFTDVTRETGLDVEMYGMGVAAGDFDNDGFPDLFISCVGQSHLFHNTGRGRFVDVTEQAGLGGRAGFSTSALWFDYDRDGLLDLFVCNYVKWSPETDIECRSDGKNRSYCTPQAYRGSTCWLFRNRGDGTFEDVTAKCGLFDSSSKSLGVAMFDYDKDGWPDIYVANDTEPNKLYRNLKNGKFEEIALRAGLAFSEDGKARAGMGVDIADYDDSGLLGLAVTNFHGEMLGLYQDLGEGQYIDRAPQNAVGKATSGSLGFGCFFFDADLDGRLDLLVVNGHIDETIARLRPGGAFAQPPHLFLNTGGGDFKDIAANVGDSFATPVVGRGAAYGDFDNDGDCDVLLTTNGGPPRLFRNDQTAGNLSIRLELVGTESNRDGIGAAVSMEAGGVTSRRTVRSGSSYLSQSELPVTLGMGHREMADRVVVRWPKGRTEEFRKVRAGRRYRCVEGKGIEEVGRYR